MRPSPLRLALSFLPLAGLALVGSTDAQEPMKRVPGFEPGRAILSDVWGFDPFRVRVFESLADALEEDKVSEETAVLLVTQSDTRLALLTEQMSYHHVAQGELSGEPWMVSF